MLEIEKKLAFKVAVFGNGGVGKTTLIRRFSTGIFEEDIKMTIGADFSVKHVDIDGRKITLRIWDFAGEERFRVLLPAFAKGADGGIFMYDTTRFSSLGQIRDWLSIFEYFIAEDKVKIPIIMVGSKIDLEEKRSVPSEDAEELSRNFDLKGYFECSSKTGERVEDIFENLAKKIIENKD
ncbi:MAG: small GTP-binding domain protein [Candidatus Lokiarchaeum sp. GC14_75]|nr:MAG: small GTP-binding domain protein [Candidatus Lokiarchaeum sp. GC14_75]